jgi:hypothetical protein
LRLGILVVIGLGLGLGLGLVNFANAGSDKEFTNEEEKEIFLGNLPERTIEYLKTSCNERKATSEDPIKDMIDEGILGVEYGGITCFDIQTQNVLSGLEDFANDLNKNLTNCDPNTVKLSVNLV